MFCPTGEEIKPKKKKKPNKKQQQKQSLKLQILHHNAKTTDFTNVEN